MRILSHLCICLEKLLAVNKYFSLPVIINFGEIPVFKMFSSHMSPVKYIHIRTSFYPQAKHSLLHEVN